MAQETQTGALYQPRGVGWKGILVEEKKLQVELPYGPAIQTKLDICLGIYPDKTVFHNIHASLCL